MGRQRKKDHKKENKKIAIDDFNPTSQERSSDKNGSKDLILKSRIVDRPSEKHHDQRGPDDREKNGEKTVNRKEVPTEHKYQARDQSS
jgi:hypothetical protein